MRRWRQIGAVGLALLAAAWAGAITVATYNVENYNLADRMVDGVFRPEYPKPESAKAAVRRVIREVAPDILALQEMGAPPFLQELQRDLAGEGFAMPHATVLEGADKHRQVAILSRLPFKEVRRHTDLPVTLFGERDVVRRGVLEVTFATDQGDLTIFTVHLKSRRTERPDDPQGATQREREAEAVRDLVLARFPEPAKAKFIVCGDFNDTRMSKPVQSMLRRGRTVLGELLRAVDGRGEVWTHYYRREDTYSRIDYFLVSAALKPLIADGQGRIHDGPGAETASDHRMVWAKLKLRGVRSEGMSFRTQ